MPPFIHPVHQVPVQLGRTVARRNALSRQRGDKLHRFLNTLPDDIAPTVCDRTSGISNWGMMLNDTLGDCTIACPGHMVQAWSALAGKEITIPDTAIKKAYSDFDGYVDGNPSTDQGGDILTVCQDWQKYGIGGHFITASAEVNMTQMRWQQGVYLFGALDAGVNLPMTAQAQIGGTLDIVGDGKTGNSAPNSWGPHCVAIVGYDLEGVTLVTWGELQRATWPFVMLYFDEALACLSPEWKPPVPIDQLEQDLVQMAT